jgi:hypothetical protein
MKACSDPLSSRSGISRTATWTGFVSGHCPRSFAHHDGSLPRCVCRHLYATRADTIHLGFGLARLPLRFPCFKAFSLCTPDFCGLHSSFGIRPRRLHVGHGFAGLHSTLYRLSDCLHHLLGTLLDSIAMPNQALQRMLRAAQVSCIRRSPAHPSASLSLRSLGVMPPVS